MRGNRHSSEDVENRTYHCDSALAEFGVNEVIGLGGDDVADWSDEEDDGDVDVGEGVVFGEGLEHGAYGGGEEA